MAGLRHTKDAVVETIMGAMSKVTAKDKKRDVGESKATDVKKAKPAAPIPESLQNPITKKLPPKEANKKVAIPDELKPVVTIYSDGTAFYCKVPSRKHKKGEQLLWALKENPEAVIVQLRLGNAGARLDNFLSLVLSRDVHAALNDNASTGPSATLSKVVKVVQTVLSVITFGTQCIVCSKPFNTLVWRPAACSPECREVMATWPLELLVSPLLLDHLVLDFLLGCIYTKRFRERMAAMTNLPARAKKITWADMVHALNTFPKLDSKLTLSSIEGADAGSAGRRLTLFWLSFAFPGCLASAFKAAMIHQFALINSTVERQVAFETDREQATPGQANFHGAPHHNLLPILADGLRKTRGPLIPIWVGFCFGKSHGYQANMRFQSWPESVFRGCSIIFGIENRGPAGHPNKFADRWSEGTTIKQSDLMVRNVFIYKMVSPQIDQSHFVLGSRTRKVMEDTFRLMEEQRVEEVRGPAQLHSEIKL
ncbi:hypothetical protein PspLS_04093 [Pyricularia sp. CBS 133598]|nr:hypothetical protein PspLS_04093 [Pyricularia sp. CBS 133598]